MQICTCDRKFRLEVKQYVRCRLYPARVRTTIHGLETHIRECGVTCEKVWLFLKDLRKCKQSAVRERLKTKTLQAAMRANGKLPIMKV